MMNYSLMKLDLFMFCYIISYAEAFCLDKKSKNSQKKDVYIIENIII